MTSILGAIQFESLRSKANHGKRGYLSTTDSFCLVSEDKLNETF